MKFFIVLAGLVASALAAPQDVRFTRSYGPFSPDSLAFSTGQLPSFPKPSASSHELTDSEGPHSSRFTISTDQVSDPGININAAIARNNVFFTGTGPTNFQFTTSGASQPHGSDVPISDVISTEDSTSKSESGSGLESECIDGEIRHIDGTCVVPEVTRRLFIFSVPKLKQKEAAPPKNLPVPKVAHNILLVRLPENDLGPEPIVVPPPRQSNIVYVIKKQNEQSQRIIEVPAPSTSEPEIYFVNYEDGENPILPGGVDLKAALGSAEETNGQLIGNQDHHSSHEEDNEDGNPSENIRDIIDLSETDVTDSFNNDATHESTQFGSGDFSILTTTTSNNPSELYVTP